MPKNMTEEFKSVAPSKSLFTPEQLAGITSFDDALRVAGQMHGEIETTNGFRRADEKAKLALCGKETLILEFSFESGDFDKEYAEMYMIVREPDGNVSKWLVSDGSTGVAKELSTWMERTGKHGGIRLPAGMRASTYPLGPDRKPLDKADQKLWRNGEAFQSAETATTFYLDIN